MLTHLQTLTLGKQKKKKKKKKEEEGRRRRKKKEEEEEEEAEGGEVRRIELVVLQTPSRATERAVLHFGATERATSWCPPPPPHRGKYEEVDQWWPAARASVGRAARPGSVTGRSVGLSGRVASGATGAVAEARTPGGPAVPESGGTGESLHRWGHGVFEESQRSWRKIGRLDLMDVWCWVWRFDCDVRSYHEHYIIVTKSTRLYYTELLLLYLVDVRSSFRETVLGLSRSL